MTSWHQGWVPAPDHFVRRKNRAAAKDAVRIHLHHILARHGQHVPGDEKNIPGAAVATGELAGAGFGFAGVGGLKVAKSFLARNSVIEEKRRSLGFLDFAELAPQGITGGWKGGARKGGWF